MHTAQSKDEKTLPRSKNLDVAVVELYAAFYDWEYEASSPDVCTFCCASPEAMDRLHRAPLRGITFEDLSEWNDAAKGENAGQYMAYLLPRTMEFMAEGRCPDSCGPFALFSKYFVPVWEQLTYRQWGAVRQFCFQLMHWRLSMYGHPGWEYSPVDIIEMVLAGGMDVNPVLDAFADLPGTDEATDAVVDLVLNHHALWNTGPSKEICNDEEHAAYVAGSLSSMFTAPDMLARLERAALMDGDDERAWRASIAHDLLDG